MSLRYPAERILVKCPNWIGDMVAATATVRCVRENYPDAEIDLLLRPYVRPVVENAPWFNRLIEYHAHRDGLLKTARALRRPRPYDLALLLTHSFRSALLARLARARIRVGHRRHGRSFLLTDGVPWPAKGPDPRLVPKVVIYRSLLEHLGCEGAADQRPEVFTSDEDEKKCERLLEAHGRDPARALLAIVPGASYGASKLWPPDRFAVVANRLADEHGMQSAILAGPGEHAIASEIARYMPNPPIRFAEGEMTFGILKAVVKRCNLMVCNDTGPRHVAIAYNIPVVTLMGPTSPVVTDSDYERTIIVRQDVPCAPCYLRVCPTNHLCMRRITPETVYGAAEELLRRYPDAGSE